MGSRVETANGQRQLIPHLCVKTLERLARAGGRFFVLGLVVVLTWGMAGEVHAETTKAQGECRADRVDLRGDWGTARFRVELAQTDEERAIGLMYRENMPRGAGMLFIYPQPQPRIAFWMKNTRISLDIIFLDAQGVVKTIAANAVPYDETPLPGGSDIQYVLEINGGLAAAMGISPGTELRHPNIVADIAAWPC
jgi:uncharacterized membrane protein (UPF0127 family)